VSKEQKQKLYKQSCKHNRSNKVANRGPSTTNNNGANKLVQNDEAKNAESKALKHTQRNLNQPKPADEKTAADSAKIASADATKPPEASSSSSAAASSSSSAAAPGSISKVGGTSGPGASAPNLPGDIDDENLVSISGRASVSVGGGQASVSADGGQRVHNQRGSVSDSSDDSSSSSSRGEGELGQQLLGLMGKKESLGVIKNQITK
jgi:hypothetical protein